MVKKYHCKVCDKTKEPSEFYANSSLICKKCKTTKLRKAYKHDPEKIRVRKNHLMACYGITLEDYEALFLAQKGCCAICSWKWELGRKRLAVDHDHKTGKVRGLLCCICNGLLGVYKDDPNVFLKAAECLK